MLFGPHRYIFEAMNSTEPRYFFPVYAVRIVSFACRLFVFIKMTNTRCDRQDARKRCHRVPNHCHTIVFFGSVGGLSSRLIGCLISSYRSFSVEPNTTSTECLAICASSQSVQHSGIDDRHLLLSGFEKLKVTQIPSGLFPVFLFLVCFLGH
ncbi:hypothetical protein QBC41DRAFT_150080 [Cercophora samala]|uniref:Uncharacterized protein n=1 Tax=Cercophora samala TaxID=330535 RepID=A0AA39ZA18_9PEZI|nr:hypothetical protein QBC41DRAFT_150080 [Cercophora samala]